jgi:ABC-type proline/glycine betaine transport system permease subunit
VGYLFGELTAVGVEYVKESVAEAEAGLGSNEVTDLWQERYRDKGYDL